MKKKSYSISLVFSLMAVICLVSCHDKSKDTPRFADWELDSLKAIPLSTPVETYGMMGTEITQKWYITMYYESDGIKESELDSTFYLEFHPDATFTLSIPTQVLPLVMEKLENMFPEEYLTSGMHTGKYSCYDAEWCGCTCDGSFGVVLSDNEDNELSRCAFIYITTDATSFTLKKVILPDPMEDVIQTDTELKLHNILK